MLTILTPVGSQLVHAEAIKQATHPPWKKVETYVRIPLLTQVAWTCWSIEHELRQNMKGA